MDVEVIRVGGYSVVPTLKIAAAAERKSDGDYSAAPTSRMRPSTYLSTSRLVRGRWALGLHIGCEGVGSRGGLGTWRRSLRGGSLASWSQGVSAKLTSRI